VSPPTGRPRKRHPSSVQTISTLPAGHSERTTARRIHLTPSDVSLMSATAAANSSNIAAFASIPRPWHLTYLTYQPRLYPARSARSAGHSPVPCVPPSGFVTASTNRGCALSPLAVEEVGKRPLRSWRPVSAEHAGGGHGDKDFVC